MEWQKYTSCIHTFIPSPGPLLLGITLPRADLPGQTKSPTYWRWTVPLNNAQMGLGALSELQSTGANG